MKTVIAASLAMTLAACASTTGNFAHTSPSVNGQLAHDAVKAVTNIKIPSQERQGTGETFGNQASTCLKLKGDPADTFYQTLWHGLTDAGFKVVGEGDRTDTKPKPLAYILDRLGTDYLRLTLLFDHSALSRLYRDQQGSITPASAWARQQP